MRPDRGGGDHASAGGLPRAPAERDRLQRLLSAEASAHDPALDAADADRLAARIRHRVQREDARPVPAARGLRGPRILALAIGVHVVALGLLALFVPGRPTAPPEAPTSVLRAPEAWTPGGGGGREDDAPPPEPTFALAAPMPIEDLVRDLAGGPAGDEALALSAPEAGPGAGPALHTSRARFLRSDAQAKYAILARVGERSDLAQVEESLRGLARRQRADGSFPAGRSEGPTGQPEGARPAASVRVTATALLAFLGDGHTSGSGVHRDVVSKGIGWLRRYVGDAASPEDRAVAAFALTEDFAFGSGAMTPSEAATRADELRALTARTAAERDAREASPWVALALDAAARAGMTRGGGDRAWAAAYAALPLEAAADPRTAVLEGTALLLSRKSELFRAWNRRASSDLKARLARGGAALDVEEVALIVLALEVPYRTY